MTETIILLVDDSRVARMMTRAAVAKLRPDWVIIEAASGEDALSAIALDRPNYVLLDVNMPGIGGLETARQLRFRCPSAAISLLTANIQDSIREQAALIGAGFMAKPLKEDELIRFLDGGSKPS
ncbi:response regulator [Paramagnetospirillum kuznetsovii]|uniref:Response regulator n=1 Tax=Paramagnetospirillum kuznetsovii TaxID=2053833 RepID=A0A364P0J5_9PROT|nr:response regulator [Paramagnetospirillum kuznetsovii]RAU22851.1 response regulator [Paramagnetospirillum kuznetsovii]